MDTAVLISCNPPFFVRIKLHYYRQIFGFVRELLPLLGLCSVICEAPLLISNISKTEVGVVLVHATKAM